MIKLKNLDLELTETDYENFIHVRNWILNNFHFIFFYSISISFNEHSLYIAFKNNFNVDLLNMNCNKLVYKVKKEFVEVYF